MTFVQRLLNVQVSLASGPEGQQRTFAESGTDTVVLSGLRMSCKIVKAGGLSDSMMDIRIWGMTASLMDQLSTLGIQVNLVPKNRIVVTAGDAVAGMATVFDGYVLAAYADYSNAPDVPFVISAQVGIPYAVIPAVATSFRGAADVATIMAGFATLMGLRFENNGVQKTLSNPNFSGSVKTQAQACVTAAGIEWNRGDNGILAIWPKNGFRGGAVPLVSSSTGMVGYPTYDAYGILVKTLFNPSIGLGGKIKVESSLKRASGEYAVYSLNHVLDAQVPNGNWFSMVGCYNPKFPTPYPR